VLTVLQLGHVFCNIDVHIQTNIIIVLIVDITGRYQGSSSIIDLTAYVYSTDLTSTDDLSITESLN
jgi:hypothetical protein